jgi:hypothetical protein
MCGFNQVLEGAKVYKKFIGLTRSQEYVIAGLPALALL